MSGARVPRRRALGQMLLAGLLPAAGAACSGQESPDDAERGRDHQGEKGHGAQSPTSSPDEPEDFTDRSPFTGRRTDTQGPVLAVKIDNLSSARPHRGVEAADLVYVEPVEAGLSRLMAVFSSRIPERVGPVRSARESDLEILGAFGRPGFAYSGANEVVLSLLADARPIRLSAGQVGEAYERASGRSAPHDLFVDPQRLLDADSATEISTARDIGFRFVGQKGRSSSVDSTRSKPAGTVTVSYPAFELVVRPDRERGGWRLEMDGQPYAANPSTVVVQSVQQRASRYARLREAGSPHLLTTGEGQATVLREGRSYPARWSRPTLRDGTTFRDEKGNVIEFTPGQVWVIYDVP